MTSETFQQLDASIAQRQGIEMVQCAYFIDI